jgi:3-oxocholest-4-en-26-oate---CoA ligase
VSKHCWLSATASEETVFHFATVYEAVADMIPDLPAIIQGERTILWAEFDDRSARLASCYLEHGLGTGSKVGMFLYNSPEYLETQSAAFKMRGCPVNVNYRYLEDELAYLLDNADCEAVVFHASLGPRLAKIRAQLPKLKLLIQVDDVDAPDAPLVDGALRYDEVLATYSPAARIHREDDDVYMLFTGGTTGMPKGVMYPAGGFAQALMGLTTTNMGRPPFTDINDVLNTIKGMRAAGIQMKSMPCCPLMHGTGVWLGAFATHLTGGCVVLMTNRGLDPDELFATVEKHGVNSIVIVGDAFARPMLKTLRDHDAADHRWDLSSMLAIISSGAMFSQEIKASLFEYMPQMRIVDTLGSTEGAKGTNVSTKDGAMATAKFQLSDSVKVFDEDDNEVQPGSQVIGRVATSAKALGVLSMGYYKDPDKTAKTFREVAGIKYSFPGDMAVVEADGSITLLGRGSNCINTGGEKVFPEEVEEAVKSHPNIADCLVFGVQDERFGQRVVGVASFVDYDGDLQPDVVIAHTKTKLSPYKAPRQLVLVPEVPRAPNGKADYRRARELFVAVFPEATS